MTRVRSKRQAEYEAHEEHRERGRREELRRIATDVREGYVNVGTLPLVGPSVCLRCSALVFGTERHDAWHAAQP